MDEWYKKSFIGQIKDFGIGKYTLKLINLVYKTESKYNPSKLYFTIIYCTLYILFTLTLSIFAMLFHHKWPFYTTLILFLCALSRFAEDKMRTSIFQFITIFIVLIFCASLDSYVFGNFHLKYENEGEIFKRTSDYFKNSNSGDNSAGSEEENIAVGDQSNKENIAHEEKSYYNYFDCKYNTSLWNPREFDAEYAIFKRGEDIKFYMYNIKENKYLPQKIAYGRFGESVVYNIIYDEDYYYIDTPNDTRYDGNGNPYSTHDQYMLNRKTGILYRRSYAKGEYIDRKEPYSKPDSIAACEPSQNKVYTHNKF